MSGRFPLILVSIWAIISSVIIWLAVGFAGGAKSIFEIPAIFMSQDYGIIALIIWLLVWIIIVAPFAILVLKAVDFVTKRK